MSLIKFGYLLARQRSGTHAIRSILSTSKHINAIGEILYSENLDLENPTQFYNYYYQQVMKNPANILNISKVFDEYLLYIGEIFPNTNNIFFDIKYNSINVLQPNWPQLDSINTPFLINKIKHDKSPVLHVTRYHYLKQYVSELIASKNNLYATEKQVNLIVNSIDINTTHMLETFNMFRREDNMINGFFNNYQNYITFDYDEVFSSSDENKMKIFRNLGQFIGDITDIKTESPFKKINVKTLPETINNYEEVSQVLKSSQFSYCLNETLDAPMLDIIRNL